MKRVDHTGTYNSAILPPTAARMCCGFVSVPVWSMATSMSAGAASWQWTAHQVAFDAATRTVRARERWVAGITPSRN